MHNTINLRTQRTTYFIPSVDVFCYCHFLKDVKFVLTIRGPKSCVLCDCFQHFVSLQQLSCTVDWCCGLCIGLLYSYYLLIAEGVKIIRWMFLLLTAGELKDAYNTTQYLKSGSGLWLLQRVFTMEVLDWRWQVARCKFIGQVDFSSRLGMTCTLTDGARKFRGWRYYRPTWPHLEGPSRLKSTYSTRLAGLVPEVRVSNAENSSQAPLYCGGHGINAVKALTISALNLHCVHEKL